VANAKVLAPALQEAGFRIVSGGTGQSPDAGGCLPRRASWAPKAELALGKAGITVNKNTIPYDVNPPLKPRASASERRR